MKHMIQCYSVGTGHPKWGEVGVGEGDNRAYAAARGLLDIDLLNEQRLERDEDIVLLPFDE